MELRTVRYFVAVADAGSVNAAAQRLHLTQPSLARQLHRLERRLNVTLLEARGGRLGLTSAGRSFLPHARELLARADAASAVVADLAAGRTPSITIAAEPLAVDAVLVPYIAELAPADICPTVITVDGPCAHGRLDAYADLALSATPPAAGLDRLQVASVPIVAYVRPDHLLAGRLGAEIAELAEHALVTTGATTEVRRRLDAVRWPHGLARPTIAEVDSERLAQAMAAAGRAVAVVAAGPSFDLSPVAVLEDGVPMAVDLYAGWKREHHAADTLEALARALQRATTARRHVARPVATGRDESAA